MTLFIALLFTKLLLLYTIFILWTVVKLFVQCKSMQSNNCRPNKPSCRHCSSTRTLYWPSNLLSWDSMVRFTCWFCAGVQLMTSTPLTSLLQKALYKCIERERAGVQLRIDVVVTPQSSSLTRQTGTCLIQCGPYLQSTAASSWNYTCA